MGSRGLAITLSGKRQEGGRGTKANFQPSTSSPAHSPQGFLTLAPQFYTGPTQHHA